MNIRQVTDNLQVSKVLLSMHSIIVTVCTVVFVKPTFGTHILHGKLLACYFSHDFQIFAECPLQRVNRRFTRLLAGHVSLHAADKVICFSQILTNAYAESDYIMVRDLS